MRQFNEPDEAQLKGQVCKLPDAGGALGAATLTIII